MSDWNDDSWDKDYWDYEYFEEHKSEYGSSNSSGKLWMWIFIIMVILGIIGGK